MLEKNLKVVEHRLETIRHDNVDSCVIGCGSSSNSGHVYDVVGKALAIKRKI